MKPRVYVTKNGGFRCDPREVMRWILATKGGRIRPDAFAGNTLSKDRAAAFDSGPAHRNLPRIIAITLGLLLSASCAARTQSVQPTPPDTGDIISHVLIDTAFIQFFANARNRQYDHKTLPNEEIVACAYGVIFNDSALVAFIRPTLSQPLGSAMVAYHPCKSLKPEVAGRIVLLGTWHNHSGPLRDGGCYFSFHDDNSFRQSDNIIELLTCEDKTIWRSKKR